MSVTVSTLAGPVQFQDSTQWERDGDYLDVLDSGGNRLATYPPGQWQSVALTGP